MALLGVAAPAHAAAPVRGRAVCTVTDHRVIGLSGLIVTATGFVAVSDSNFDKTKIRIWFLNRECQVTRSVSYPTSAYDPEDAALGRDGTIYVADIGDNDRERASIAVWRLARGSSTPHLYRYRYPDHPHDAEAMLLNADDTPIFVTKDIGVGEIYVPAGRADPSHKPILLKHVGSFPLSASNTPNGLGILGPMLVTGGANTADRSRVALRTYADAFVWNVTGGDILRTITTSKPTEIPLPNEPQGEGIAFDPSGTHLYTVSDRETTPVRTKILEYTLPPPRSHPPSQSPGKSSRLSSAAGRALRVPAYAFVAAAGVGLMLIIGGIAVLVRRRT
jgi:hypothetical protein